MMASLRLVVAVVALGILPALSTAQAPAAGPGFQGNFKDGINKDASSIATTGGLTDPSKKTIEDIIIGVINFILSLIAILATLAIVVGAVMYILSVGNEQKVARAKNVIIYAVAGLVLAGVSFVIIQGVVNLIAP